MVKLHLPYEVFQDERITVSELPLELGLHIFSVQECAKLKKRSERKLADEGLTRDLLELPSTKLPKNRGSKLAR